MTNEQRIQQAANDNKTATKQLSECPAEKDAAIKELVEGLGTLRHGIFESEKAVNDFIDSLITKYKK